MLYTFRSISRAIPSYSKDDSDDEKTKINKQTYEVLKPEMDKLKELMSYQRDCRNFVVSIIHDLSDLDKTTVRER